MGSITEVVQTVKDPKSIIQSMSHDTVSKHEEQEKINFDFVLPKSVETESPSLQSRQTPSLDFQGDISRVSSCHDRSKNSRKSGRISFIGYIFLSCYFNLCSHFSIMFSSDSSSTILLMDLLMNV